MAISSPDWLAEGARFELADPLRGLQFSRLARSAAPSPLRAKNHRMSLVKGQVYEKKNFTIVFEYDVDVLVLTRIIHEHFCCESRIRCCDKPSAGRLAVRSLDVLFKYASGSHGSACPSHDATARFRNEPS